MEKSTSPLPHDHPAWDPTNSYRKTIAILYPLEIDLLRDLLIQPSLIDKYEYLWKPEQESFLATEKAIQTGEIRFIAHPKVDVTVTVCRTNFRPNMRSIHNHCTTLGGDILVNLPENGNPSFVYNQRYEASVDFHSVHVRKPVDCHDLAARLTTLEREAGSNATWEYFTELTWDLHLRLKESTMTSSLTWDRFCDEVISNLKRAYNVQ
jgi:hypothetical protein